LETEASDGTKTSSVYDATHIRATAVANFASSSQIAFTSFEDPSTGNWTYSNSLVVDTDNFSGVKSFKSNGNSVYITKSLDAAQYEISYWIKDGSATLELSGGSVQQTFTEEEQNGWTLTRIFFTMTNSGVVKIRVPQNTIVDDVRLKPKGADMITTVYNAEGNMIVRTNNSLFNTRFEYDGQYRLTNLRNHKREIVKQYKYHYRDQQ
jgi:YD repeat-containing protein